MKYYLLVFLTVLWVSVADVSAQQAQKKPQPISINFATRGSFNNAISTPGDTVLHNTGFSLDYFAFNLKGNFSDKVSYNVRLNMNKLTAWSNILNAFDALHVDWQISPQWKVSAGKQMVYIGGYEYDYDPINVYYWSLANNYVTAYEVGVMGAYTTPDGHHTVVAQVCNSPYNANSHDFKGLMAYNVSWYGNFGFYKPIWSVNMMNYQLHKYVNFLALGNRFTFDPVAVELDYHNRYFLGQGMYFEDFSLIGKLIVDVKGWANVMLKGGVDYNGTGRNDDPWVCSEFGPVRAKDLAEGKVREAHLSGYLGAGVEFFPLTRKNSKDLRLHLYWMMDNRNGRGFDQHYVSLGISWWFRALERD